MKKWPGLPSLSFTILFVTVLIFCSSTVQAQTFSTVGPEIALPDGNPPLCSNPGAYVCRDIVVSGLPAFAILRSATIGIRDHGSIGSLDVDIRAPGGSPIFQPFSRTGSTSPADCGDTTDIEGEYSFQDSAIGNWWATAAALDSTTNMPPGTYSPSFPGGGPSPPAGNPNNTMSQTFSGITNGTWQVCIRDWDINGGGRYLVARLTFAVPTAAAASIGGRVLTAGGKGIMNATVILTGGNLPEPVTTRSTSFGYFNFPNIPSGGVYVVTVQAKRYTFSNPTQVINLQEDIKDVYFVADGY